MALRRLGMGSANSRRAVFGRRRLIPDGAQSPPYKGHKRRRRIVLALVVMAAGLLALAFARKREKPPASDAFENARFVADLALRDTARTLHDFRAPSHKAVVFFLLGTECPVSNAYAPEMARIAKDYEPRGIATFGVHPDPDVTPGVAASHAADYRLGFPILLDPTQELAEAAGAEVTPEAIVVDDGGMVVYRGRIDDTYARDGKRRDKPSTRDLRDVLDAISDGKTPAPIVRPAFGCPLPTPAPVVGDGETVTFTKQIAPILWDHCGRCHRPGEVGPFSLLTHADAAKRAGFLRDVVESGRMPPWKALPGHGHFLDENRLTRRERALLDRWAEDGAPQGDPANLPPAPKYPDGWALGQPDLVLTMAEPYTIPADGGDVFRGYILPLPTDGDRPIAAIEFRPGNRKVVHHARIFVDETPDCRTMDADDPGLGFAFDARNDIPKPSLCEWNPGASPRRPRPGVGRTLKAGSDIAMLIHYHASGKDEVDRSSVGLYFSDRPPERILGRISLSSAKIDIPPGEPRHRIVARRTVPVDSSAESILPHGHNLLREMTLTATLPDGRVVRMLRLDDWDIHWQGQYHLREPVPLPAGTKLEVVAVYDNSSANPRNPFTPPRRVRYGPNSDNEMLGCHVYVVADRPEGDAVYGKWMESGR
jgi:peroxiredoxin